jgi:hypothetical protein
LEKLTKQRRVALIGGVSLLVLAGCSSGAPPSTKAPNVPPRPPNATSVASYLTTGAGAPFLSFEKSTKVLGSGTIPAKAVCAGLVADGRPLSSASYEGLTKAVKGIPNIAFEVDANEDVQAKLHLVIDCVQGKASASDASTAQNTSNVVTSELKELNVPS